MVGCLLWCLCLHLSDQNTWEQQLKGRKFYFGTQLQSTIHPSGEDMTQLIGDGSPWLSLVHVLAVDQEIGREG